MKTAFLLIVIFCGLTVESFSQIGFIKHYGDFTGPGNSLIINSNGNYVTAGRKNQGSIHDQFCSYELNNFGEILWLKHYGTDSLDHANQIIQTIDGGYATIGSSAGYWSSYQNIYLVKTTNTGTISWTKQIGGQGQENGAAIVQSITGEYFIGGASSYNSNGLLDFYLIKADVNGDTLWSKKYGGIQNEVLTSMQQTLDGGFILSGYSESFSYGSRDFYLIKTNIVGDTIWTKHYGGNLDEISKSVKQTSDGGYIITGYSQSFGISTENMYVVKTNSVGDTLWTKTYGQSGRFSWGNDIIQTADGGYAITGLIKTASPNGGFDLYLVKIDTSGTVQWENEFKIEPSNSSYTSSKGLSILQTSDRGFAMLGSWFSGRTIELLLIKTDNNGTVGIGGLTTDASFKLFPNPFNQSTTLKFDNSEKEVFTLTIYDIHGQIVWANTNIKSNMVEITRQNLTNGFYVFRLQSVSKSVSGKIIIE